MGDAGLGLQALLPLLEQKSDREHLDDARSTYAKWQERQAAFTDPAYDAKPKGLLRRKVDNPDSLIRPELLAAALDRHAAQDAIFTTDTGMATVWLSRFVRMTGHASPDRLVQPRLDGERDAAGTRCSALDRKRQVVAFCGDGGLSMLMGDLITAVSYELPVKLVVFDNGRLGMVKLEMEQVGLPEFGTVLRNPDFAKVAEAIGMRGIRVEQADDVDAAVKEALALDGPGAAGRGHQPERGRHPTLARPSSRAGASRSPRPRSSSTAPSEQSPAETAHLNARTTPRRRR